MEKVKENIIEDLILQEAGTPGKSNVMCLIGPPGVGKTTLAQSIATALGRKYVMISLSSIHTNSDLVGLTRSYMNSQPGFIIKKLREAGVNNPLFLLDEIDKVPDESCNGNPKGILLSLLDPNQRNA
jgi:ATP-dependent Lon protease